MKAVIFDMDGLMFDTERVFVMAWDYAGEKLGIGKAGYMNIKTLGMNAEMCNEILTQEFGNDFDIAGLKKYSKEFLLDYYDHNKVPIKKGLIGLIKYLKENEYKIAVASSTPTRKVKKYLKDAGIIHEFNAIVCGDMIEQSKPEPDIYLRACKLIEEDPSDCYAIEDSKNGLLSAYRAGCKIIMVPDLWEPDAEIKTVLHKQLEDLDQVRVYFETIDIKHEKEIRE